MDEFVLESFDEYVLKPWDEVLNLEPSDELFKPCELKEVLRSPKGKYSDYIYTGDDEFEVISWDDPMGLIFKRKDTNIEDIKGIIDLREKENNDE